MSDFPNSIFELIDTESFRQRPGMYLGQKNIDLLNAFIDGYQYAIEAFEISDFKSLKFKKFRIWVLAYYKAGQYTGGWKDIILEKCNGDRQKAVDTFFDLYDHFKSAE
jgi:hypothetical protein